MSIATLGTDSFQPIRELPEDNFSPIRDRGIWRRASLVYLIAAMIAMAYYVGVKGSSRSAFPRWRPQVLSLFEGKDIYALHAFPTPPIMGLVLAPFYGLPVTWGMAGWFLFKVALVIWMVDQLRRVLDDAGIIRPAWIDVLAVALAARPILGDLLHGNVNLWILFLVVASFLAFRERKDAISGLALALAISCKVTPALLVVYFAWKRAYAVVAWCLVGMAAWLIVVPGSVLGFENNFRLLHGWSRQILVPYVVHGMVDTEQVNQSLPALYYRLVTPSMAIKPDDGRAPISVNLVNWPKPLARFLLTGIQGAMLAGLLFLCRTSPQDRRSLMLVHEFAFVLFAMLLMSERSWKHHYVGMLVSYFALLATFWMTWRTRQRTRAYGLAAAIAASALVLLPTSTDIARPVWGVDGAKLAQAYGAYVWAAIALMISHAMSLRWLNQGGNAG